jgi:hypothetical protein
MSITELVRNEQGVSYPLIIIVFTLILGTGVYIIGTPIVNVITKVFNLQIDRGIISDQTVACYAFNVNLYKIMPLFFILGLFLYGIVQALLRKQEGL